MPRFTRSQKDQKEEKDSSQMINIQNQKMFKGKRMYLVKFSDFRQQWTQASHVPQQLIDKYLQQKQSSYELESSKEQEEKKKNDNTEKQKMTLKECKKKQSSSRQIMTRRKTKKTEVIEIQDSSFYNQVEQQSINKTENKDNQSQQNSKKQRKIQKSKTQLSTKIQQKQKTEIQKNNQNLNNKNSYVQVVAQVQSTSSQQQQMQGSSDCSSNHSMMHLKKPKMKVSKTKTKKIKKNNKILLNYVEQDNIIARKNRDLGRKNYKQPGQLKLGRQKKDKLNFSQVEKQFYKNISFQNNYISTVLQQGMYGPYKMFLVKLRNGEEVYVRQKNMKFFFPRKLLEYYKRILNKVSKSTHQCNFTL